MKILLGKWHWLFSGAMLAVLILLGLYLFDAPLGLSDALSAFSVYCRETVETQSLDVWPELNWQNGILLGVFIGAFCSALCTGEWRLKIGFDDASGFSGKTWENGNFRCFGRIPDDGGVFDCRGYCFRDDFGGDSVVGRGLDFLWWDGCKRGGAFDSFPSETFGLS